MILTVTVFVLPVAVSACSSQKAIQPPIREIPNANFSFPRSIESYLRLPVTVANFGVTSCTKKNIKTICEPFTYHPGIVVARLYGSGSRGVPAQSALFHALAAEG